MKRVEKDSVRGAIEVCDRLIEAYDKVNQELSSTLQSMKSKNDSRGHWDGIFYILDK